MKTTKGIVTELIMFKNAREVKNKICKMNSKESKKETGKAKS